MVRSVLPVESIIGSGVMVSHGTIYKKRKGAQPINLQKDYHGWAQGRLGRYEVFRSRRNREVWLTKDEFDAEYAAIRNSSIGQFFTSRKGFRPANPMPQLRAYQQLAGHKRIAITWDDNLQPVRLARGMS